MYLAIVCANCGKPSQVAEGLLGQIVQCPLCGKPTVALPVAKPVQQEPLSLDDAPSISDPVQAGRVVEAGDRRSRVEPEKTHRMRSPVRTAVYATISLLLTLALMGGIYAAFKYGDAKVPDRSWSAFAPPGGNCTIILPGEPAEQPIKLDRKGVADGKRFVVERWFERVELSFGWVDFNAESAANRRFDDLAADARKAATEGLKLEGALTSESTASFVAKGRKYEVRRYEGDLKPGIVLVQLYFDPDPEKLRYQLRTEVEMQDLDIGIPAGWDLNGPTLMIQVPVEYQRRVVEPGQTIRIYFATAAGKKLTRDMPWVARFFNSFSPD